MYIIRNELRYAGLISLPGATVDISLIIPTRDRQNTLKRCLDSLQESPFSRFEVIVVDDCSQQNVSDLVKAYGHKIVRLDKPSGAWHARNRGAQEAQGNILVFIDSDMIIPPDGLPKIHRFFLQNNYAALSGINSCPKNSENFATCYKSLWMHYSYLCSPQNFDWFISGIGAVKRDVFFRLKGFDTSFITQTGGGDLEFGRRLKEAGLKIFLDKELQGNHLKQFTVFSLIKNDYNRSKGWFRLILRKKMVPDVLKKLRLANIYPQFIVSVLAVLLFFPSIFLSFVSTQFLLIALASLAIYMIANFNLFRFFHQKGGLKFLLKAIPFSFLDHLVSGFGVIAGGWDYWTHPMKKPERTLP